MMDYRYENLNPVPVMYQSGYLTFKGYDKESERYVLRFPNDEVKYGFLTTLLPIYYTKADELSEINYNNFVEDLLNEDIDTFIDEKNYARKYNLSGKKIIKISVVFNNEKRNIREWKAKMKQSRKPKLNNGLRD